MKGRLALERYLNVLPFLHLAGYPDFYTSNANGTAKEMRKLCPHTTAKKDTNSTAKVRKNVHSSGTSLGNKTMVQFNF